MGLTERLRRAQERATGKVRRQRWPPELSEGIQEMSSAISLITGRALRITSDQKQSKMCLFLIQDAEVYKLIEVKLFELGWPATVSLWVPRVLPIQGLIYEFSERIAYSGDEFEDVLGDYIEHPQVLGWLARQARKAL